MCVGGAFIAKVRARQPAKRHHPLRSNKFSKQAVKKAVRQIPLTWIIVARKPEPIAMAKRVVVSQQWTIVQDVMQIAQATVYLHFKTQRMLLKTSFAHLICSLT